ncbi:MAG TPA: GerAB/ArcD/ProY family transporter [Clostridia bacterium]|nr:GerAB/ArcD/ProY family transporter [Clostridia bacterium]
MKNSVSNRQMSLILLLVLTAVTIIGLPGIMARSAGYGSWFTLILTSVPFAISALMIVSLNKKFQGEVLFDYSKKLVGKVGSYILGVFFLLYFLYLSSYLCASMTNILVANFFVHTPQWFIVLLSIPFYGYSAYKGITPVARVCEVFGSVFLVVTLISYIMMFMQGEVNHILPLYVPEDTVTYLSAIKRAVPSFLGVEVLTLIPLDGKSRKRAPWVAFFAVLGIGLYYALNVESSIMMNGMSEIRNEDNALITAIRQVQIPALSFFERLDLLYLTVGFSGLFAAKTIVMLAVMEYGCKLLPNVKRLYIALGVMLAVFLGDLYAFGKGYFGEFFETFCLTAGPVASFGIPALLLILAKVKGYGKKTS